MKTCNRCGREKATRHFHRDRTKRDGYCPTCKQCKRPVAAATYRRSAAKKRAYARAYYAENRDDILAAQRAAYRADLDAARELRRLHGDARRKRPSWRAYQRTYQAELRRVARKAD